MKLEDEELPVIGNFDPNRKWREQNIMNRQKQKVRRIAKYLFIIIICFLLYAFFHGEIDSFVTSLQNQSFQNLTNNDHEYTWGRSEIDVFELELKIHQLINEERTSRGLSSLEWNPALNQIARKYSEDMAKRKYFSHESPEGHDLLYRYSQDEFTCQVSTGDYMYISGAENIFLNYLYESITYYYGIPSYDWLTQEEIARTTVDGWMNSPGHRSNILNPYLQTEGIGVNITESGEIYITQDFC